MGNWNMTIVGVGSHHNVHRDEQWRDRYDADEQFKNFVNELKKSGHSIHHASFTHGAGENHTAAMVDNEVVIDQTDR